MVEASNGDTEWGITEHLQALTVDYLAGAQWSRQGGKGPRPKPIPRPGVTDPDEKFGSAHSREELDELLARFVGPRGR